MHRARISNTGQEFPIGKILCIGRNYAEHIRELGNETPEAPVIFMKPASSVIGDGDTIVIPPYSRDCHHEAELALLVGRGGKDISPDCAMEHLAGFGVAIDLTLRDVQGELKKKGSPGRLPRASTPPARSPHLYLPTRFPTRKTSVSGLQSTANSARTAPPR